MMSILGQKAHWKPQYYTNHASYEYNTDYFSRCSWRFHPGKKLKEFVCSRYDCTGGKRFLQTKHLWLCSWENFMIQNICGYVIVKRLRYKTSVIMLLWNVYNTKHLWLCSCETFMIRFPYTKHQWEHTSSISMRMNTFHIMRTPSFHINENIILPHQWQDHPSTSMRRPSFHIYENTILQH